ncbi:MAG: hypothetical protein ACOZCO_15300 [Bacteroidota bacterium]
MKSKSLLILTVIVAMFVASSAGAQEKMGKTFTLSKGDAMSVSLEKYQAAIESGDFNCYRFKNKRRTIVFDTGVVLELYSASEILQGGTLPANNCFMEDSYIPKASTFSLHESGIVIEIITPDTKSTQKTEGK